MPRDRRSGHAWGRALSMLAMVLAMALPIASVLTIAPPVADADASCQARRRAHGTRATRRARARRARAPRLTPAQRRQIVRWHARASTTEVRAWSRLAPPPLVFLPLRGRERVTLAPSDDETFDAEDLALAQQALGTREGLTAEIHPRLIELVYRAVRHFRAPYVHVISGYRTGRATSRHAQGRALDFVLPGVSDRRLSAWLRPQGFVGVGIYPTSGFVHLDVRARSYFWSDSSGPSQSNRERPMLLSQVARYDAAGRRRGEEAVPNAVAVEGPESESESEPPVEIEIDVVETTIANPTTNDDPASAGAEG